MTSEEFVIHSEANLSGAHLSGYIFPLIIFLLTISFESCLISAVQKSPAGEYSPIALIIISD